MRRLYLFIPSESMTNNAINAINANNDNNKYNKYNQSLMTQTSLIL